MLQRVRGAYWEWEALGECLMRWEGAEEGSCLQWVKEAGCSEVCRLQKAMLSQMLWAQVAAFLHRNQAQQFAATKSSNYDMAPSLIEHECALPRSWVTARGRSNLQGCNQASAECHS